MNIKAEILSPPELWDEAERQIDYDREDRAGWNGNQFKRGSGANIKTRKGEIT